MQFLGKGHRVPKGIWPLYLLDHSDQPGALGYHLDQHGRIQGKVFAADDQRYGVSWTVDLTHELLEMLGDPTTDTLINLPDGRQYIREVCDAVEDDSVAYMKNGVLVSDFVTPAYFFESKDTKYDFCGKLNGTAPTLTPGGYLGIYDRQPDNGRRLPRACRTASRAIAPGATAARPGTPFTERTTAHTCVDNLDKPASRARLAGLALPCPLRTRRRALCEPRQPRRTYGRTASSNAADGASAVPRPRRPAGR